MRNFFDKNKRKNLVFLKGFSLIELAVVLGISLVLGVVVLTTLLGRRSRVELDNTTKQIVSTLREAQSRAVSGEGNTVWGVHLENSTTTASFYALFYTSYTTSTKLGYWRLPTSIRYATSSIAQGSSLDITFAQISGLPSTSTSVTLGGTGGGGVVTATSTITISAGGLITF